MGMYCCCEWKMTGSTHIDIPNGTTTYYEADPNGCTCNWDGWTSRFDWPEERKNKDKPFAQPTKNGKYYVRVQSGCGDRYEEMQTFSTEARKIRCGYTGKELCVHWSGNDESQPYAWRELREEEKE